MARKKLSVRIQLITLCPLIIGILICTILAIAILFDNFKVWVSDTKDYIKDSEYDSLGTISQITSNIIGSKIRQRVFELNALDQMYSNNIELASSYQDVISTVNYYKITDYSKDKSNNKTLWLSDNKEFDNFEDYKESLKNKTAVVDVFMKAFVTNTRNSIQIGMVVNKDTGLPSGQILDYRYPIFQLNFTNKANSNSDCGKKGQYSTVCTDSFQELKSSDSQILTYTEEDSIKLLKNSDSGAFIYYLPQDYFDPYFLSISGYNFFISDSSANRIIRVIHLNDHENDYEFNSSNTKVSENLFKNDEELSKEAEKGLSDSIVFLDSSNSSQFEIKGYYSTYYASISYTSIELEGSNSKSSISQPNSLISGAYINKGYIYKNYNSVLDDIIDTIIIQMVIFLVLLGLTCFIAWVLAVEITDRIVEPIYLFERFLRNKPVSIDFDKNYNKEVNSILNFLRLLKTLENMIEPRFFLHPNLQEREQNLKDSLDLFDSIKNKRGKSIVLNLLGNIAYMNKQYPQAVECYYKSVNQIEELIKEVEAQSKGEKELTDEEKEKLNLNLENTEKNWEIEKKCLVEMAFDKKLQLCMGLLAEVLNSNGDLVELRSKMKEVNKIQKQVLQFFVDEKIQYFNMIKLLIDMASVYKELKYFHSAVEVLDFVQDELKKLGMSDGSKIDIDIGRLCKLGLIISSDKSENPGKHFEVKDYTFEKDILMQMATYNKGKIFIEYGKPYEAALALSASIEKGEFYDPSLRRNAVNSLIKLLEKKNCEVPESLQALKSDFTTPKYSVLFLLAYDLSTSKLNSKISDFIEDKLVDSFKIGAVTLNPNPKLRMKTWQRDSAKADFDDLIIASKNPDNEQSVLDAIILAADEFDNMKKDKKIMIVILDKFTENGFSIREDLHLIGEKEIYLYILAKEGVITNNTILEKFNEIGASFTEFELNTLDKVLNSLYKVILDS